MADVDDLWYEDNPDNPGKKRPTPGHGAGKRYMARWRDPSGRQRKQRFDRNRDADQHLAKVATDKQAGAYVDPSAGRITFEAYAEPWRTGRTHDMATARRIEREFRLHAYEDPKRRGRTRRDGVAIGQHQLGTLAQSPSIMQAWIKGIPLAVNSARLVILDVGQDPLRHVHVGLQPGMPRVLPPARRSPPRGFATERACGGWAMRSLAGISQSCAARMLDWAGHLHCLPS